MLDHATGYLAAAGALLALDTQRSTGGTYGTAQPRWATHPVSADAPRLR